MKEHNIFGGGADTTRNGNMFENEASVEKMLIANGYTVFSGVVTKNGEHIGLISSKSAFYTDILHVGENDVRKKYGKTLEPDAVFLNKLNHTLYILEMKSQKTPGSVDEKIQTCEYKLRFYNSLRWDYGLEETINHIRFYYILSDYFHSPAYREALRFIQDKGCDYYFNTVEPQDLGLQKPERAFRLN